MNLFKKFLSFKEESDSNNMTLNRQQVSQFVAMLLFLLFFIFMAGYYWGKKNVAQHLSEQLETDSLADKVSYAFYSMHDAQDEAQAPSEEAASEEVESQSNDESSKEASKNIHYYAQLAGFGTQSAAQDYVNKLLKEGYEVKLAPRRSKTSSGKIINWYQAVTPTFADYQALVKYVDEIKKISKLNDVKIMEVEKQTQATE